MANNLPALDIRNDPLFDGWATLIQNGDANKFTQYVNVKDCLRKNTCPVVFRKVILAQVTSESRPAPAPIVQGANGAAQPVAQAQQNGQQNELGDNRSVRVKLFMTATVGTAVSLLARTIRIVIWTAFLVFTVLYHVGKSSRYGLDGDVKEHLRRYAHEWIDFGMTIISCPLALIKMVKPDAFSATTWAITKAYSRRIDNRNAYDRRVNQRIAAYNGAVERANVRRAAANDNPLDLGAQQQGEGQA